MADTGWLSPSAGRNLDVGGVSWLVPAKVTVDDGDYTSATNVDTNPSDTLNGYTYGANIPTDATINGIEVRIDRYCSHVDEIKDSTLHLMDDTATKGSNKADTVNYWPTTTAFATYGGSTDLWGAAWTYSQINASTFGVGLSGVSVSYETLYVDVIQVKIYYTEPQTASVADTLNLADTILSNPGVSLADILNLSDAMSVNLSSVVADILSFDDTVPLHWSVAVNDILSFGDLLPRHYSATASDTLTLNDITNIIVAYIVLVSFLSIAPSMTFTGTASSVDFEGKIQEASMGEN